MVATSHLRAGRGFYKEEGEGKQNKDIRGKAGRVLAGRIFVVSVLRLALWFLSASWGSEVRLFLSFTQNQNLLVPVKYI